MFSELGGGGENCRTEGTLYQTYAYMPLIRLDYRTQMTHTQTEHRSVKTYGSLNKKPSCTSLSCALDLSYPDTTRYATLTSSPA